MKIGTIIMITWTIAIISCQEMTFDTIPVGKECGSYRPTKSEDCTMLNNTKEFCCFMTSPSGKNFCYRVDVKKWDYRTSLRIENYIYQMKCDVLQDLFDAIFGNNPPPSDIGTAPTSNEGRRPDAEEANRNPDQCGKEDPSSANDCTSAHTLTDFCCHMKPQNGSKNFCKKMSPMFIEPATTTLIIGNDTFDIDCNIKDGSQGLPCGTSSPSGVSDCSGSSTEYNSCCYYNDSQNKYCIWLGYKGNSGEVMTNLTC